MNDTITVVGNLATPPETKHLPDGTPVTSFRLASSRRKFDTGAGRFVDVDANYYTVSAYREFGQHVAQSLTKGSRVVVTGRLRLRSWQSEHGWRTSPEVDADAIGPDLRYGVTSFRPQERSTSERTPSEASDTWTTATPGVSDSSENGALAASPATGAAGDWGAPAPEAEATPF
tara:strand:- start:197 stop:718 length:522 start_codon:yes stop_codon:yes gene_type:complete